MKKIGQQQRVYIRIVRSSSAPFRVLAHEVYDREASIVLCQSTHPTRKLAREAARQLRKSLGLRVIEKANEVAA